MYRSSGTLNQAFSQQNALLDLPRGSELGRAESLVSLVDTLVRECGYYVPLLSNFQRSMKTDISDFVSANTLSISPRFFIFVLKSDIYMINLS